LDLPAASPPTLYSSGEMAHKTFGWLNKDSVSVRPCPPKENDE
jgi:hypothetical protein